VPSIKEANGKLTLRRPCPQGFLKVGEGIEKKTFIG
jgi:hypothetical protein